MSPSPPIPPHLPLVQIMQLKKAVPKGDKAKLKDANQKIAKLQTDMAARHKQELLLAASGMSVCGQAWVGEIVYLRPGLGMSVGGRVCVEEIV